MSDYIYSISSERKLQTCHEDLQDVFRRVLEIIDHKILEGHRGQPAQTKAFRTGHSKVPWPKGKHNGYPSDAVDASPYPVLWPEYAESSKEKLRRINRFYYFAGIVIGVAEEMGITLRWGGDWNFKSRDLDHQRFNDLVHFERVIRAG